jgi:diguanylate cyclase (GGDEF)-like protein
VRIPRDRWPTLIGLLGGAALLLALGGGQQLREVEWTSRSFLGLDFGAWSLATTFLAVFLIVQIVLNTRHTLVRERRLVEIAADLRETSAELERLAKVDPLTGVLNRRAFFERLETEFRRAQRYGRPVTVLMLDIDRFKALNDRYGHATGDAVLAVCAGHLASNLRQSDEIGRYGGEEFVIFLPETSLADGAFVAEKLRQAVEELRIDSPDGASGAVHVTTSVGVACGPALDTPDSQSLVNHADAALYVAKRTGRNRISVSETGAAGLVRQPAS